MVAYFLCSGFGRIKNPSEVSVFLNQVTYPEGVKCVFGFNEKCFHVACNDLNHVPLEGLG